ncbi:hypothetical protein BJ508DRAFT_303289 [Ascobolus immersus RN42]|uniref:Uncharacterized protein n=1 Tax=Ascobolus immersus RN42 TaxID=1160509 RepID=A0A3N4IFG7_ASCIM|nr:hypothetical protein BJ508DRAFT_303289 [Ascobolus immersus RN42]
MFNFLLPKRHRSSRERSKSVTTKNKKLPPTPPPSSSSSSDLSEYYNTHPHNTHLGSSSNGRDSPSSFSTYSMSNSRPFTPQRPYPSVEESLREEYEKAIREGRRGSFSVINGSGIVLGGNAGPSFSTGRRASISHKKSPRCLCGRC